MVPSSLHKHGARIAALFPLCPSFFLAQLAANTLLGENQQRRKHKEKKDIEKVKLTALARSHSLAPASRKTRQFVLRQINFLKYADLPVVAGSFIARMFYGHIFFFLALHRTSTSCARIPPPLAVPVVHLPFVPTHHGA